MIEIPLAAIPNQTLSITLDEIDYVITINATNRANGDIPGSLIMAVTIVRDDVLIVSGQRAMQDYPLIPYPYLESGNFAFVTLNDDYPDYRQFGITQSLIYASQAELAVIRAGT